MSMTPDHQSSCRDFRLQSHRLLSHSRTVAHVLFPWTAQRPPANYCAATYRMLVKSSYCNRMTDRISTCPTL